MPNSSSHVTKHHQSATISPNKYKLGAAAVIALVGLSLTGCQAMATKNAPIAAKADSTSTVSNGIKTTKNIAYGTDARQQLDIYTPADGQRHPVLIFVYGGSWQHGKRQTYGFVGKQFAKSGYTTVVVDYRLAPANVFPDYVLDTASAMGWVYRNIAQYGGNPNQLFVMGHSAGAFNVVSAVDDSRFWKTTGIPNKAILGVIGLAGPYDYDFRSGTTKVAFPANSTRQQVMPVYHIRQDVPPHLLVTGSKDMIVYPQNADSLQKALTQAGGNVERVQVPATHVGVVIGLAAPLQSFYPTFNKVNDFMQRHLPTAQ